MRPEILARFGGSFPLNEFFCKFSEINVVGREGSEPVNKLVPNSNQYKFVRVEIDDGRLPAIEFSKADNEFNFEKFPISFGRVPVKLQESNDKDET
jgi:hypothetical protein